MKKYPLVLIEWEDSRQPEPSWQWLEDFTPKSVCICKTVGFLIYNGKKAKAIAQNLAEDMQVSGVIHIPTRCISKVTNLS